jgi:hypothetical protein
MGTKMDTAINTIKERMVAQKECCDLVCAVHTRTNHKQPGGGHPGFCVNQGTQGVHEELNAEIEETRLGLND